MNADCPTSNEGEVLWLLAPDPARIHGFDPIPTDQYGKPLYDKMKRLQIRKEHYKLSSTPETPG